MNSLRKSPPSQRILAVALLATVLATLYTIVVSPLIAQYDQYRDALGNLRLEQQKLSALIHQARAQIPPASLPDLRSLRVPSLTIDGAVAQTQQWLRAHAEETGIGLSSLTGALILGDPTLSTVTVQARFTATFSQCRLFFHAIEGDPIPARIERLTIMPPATPAVAEDHREQLVDVQLDVATWYPHNE